MTPENLLLFESSLWAVAEEIRTTLRDIGVPMLALPLGPSSARLLQGRMLDRGACYGSGRILVLVGSKGCHDPDTWRSLITLYATTGVDHDEERGGIPTTLLFDRPTDNLGRLAKRTRHELARVAREAKAPHGIITARAVSGREQMLIAAGEAMGYGHSRPNPFAPADGSASYTILIATDDGMTWLTSFARATEERDLVIDEIQIVVRGMSLTGDARIICAGRSQDEALRVISELAPYTTARTPIAIRGPVSVESHNLDNEQRKLEVELVKTTWTQDTFGKIVRALVQDRSDLNTIKLSVEGSTIAGADDAKYIRLTIGVSGLSDSERVMYYETVKEKLSQLDSLMLSSDGVGAIGLKITLVSGHAEPLEDDYLHG